MEWGPSARLGVGHQPEAIDYLESDPSIDAKSDRHQRRLAAWSKLVVTCGPVPRTNVAAVFSVVSGEMERGPDPP